MPQGKDEETWVEQAREHYEWAEQIQRKFMEGEDLDTILG